jgi:SAM-dependent methyltransferase
MVENNENEKRGPIEDWDEYYRDTSTEELPWYSTVPDPEVIEALKNFCKPAPALVLDLGTGPGTMAIEFARLGYEVTACDISDTALNTAKLRAGELAQKVTFLVSDIREPLTGSYDIINDRGCFHVFREGDRAKYIDNISAIMKPGAVLLLKTFSINEPGDEGPCRYSVEEIREIFSGGFDMIFSRDTIFQSTMETDPKALLCVLKRSA